MESKDFIKDWAEHPMRKPRVDKVSVDIGVGSAGDKMDSALALLERLTGKKPVQTYSKHRIPGWGLRKGLPIGAKVTLRKNGSTEFLKRALKAIDNSLMDRNFDDLGNLSFGVEQYIFFDNIRYDPKIGTMGLQVSATIERPGFRTKRRKIQRKKVGIHHRVLKDEAMAFIEKEFGVTIENG
ncbi:MAG: 50S ribosomal protein L5 [Candidatus Altiarchaeota archaeon]|nr:50S ribosomal protein L5 [Candidatus Altiarchaeota archaeon]